MWDGLAEPSCHLCLLLRSLTASSTQPGVTGLHADRVTATLQEGESAHGESGKFFLETSGLCFAPTGF